MKEERLSLPLKEKYPTELFDELFGFVLRVVSGGVVSTTQSSRAGVRSTFPAVSVARTSSTWVPSASEDVVYEDAQLVQPAPSRLHSNVADSSLEMVKFTTSDDGVDPNRFKDVSGGVRSTTHE